MTRDRNTPASTAASAEEEQLLRQLLLDADGYGVEPAATVAEEATIDTAPSPTAPRTEKSARRTAPTPPRTQTGKSGGRGAPPPPPAAEPDDAGDHEEAGMSLFDHLIELRTRLVRASLGVLGGMVIGLLLVLGPFQLMDFIISTFAPTNDLYPPVQAVGTAEAFTSYMTVALTIGIILGMPVIVYQLFAFIRPGLTREEKFAIYKAMPFVIGFFATGLAFGWFITVPTAIRFLIGFSDSALIQVQPTLSDFIRTITLLLVMNGVVFELPIIIYVLALLKIVTPTQLRSYRRYALVAVVIVAAIITPTGDPVNLALLALPMYLLFELGILLAHIPARRR
jgi:sec-independent protein translocase protein TatC